MRGSKFGPIAHCRTSNDVSGNSRWVSKGLYDRAVKALGRVGITYVITLMGYYTSVSMTLAFYDVPAHTRFGLFVPEVERGCSRAESPEPITVTDRSEKQGRRQRY